MIIYEDGLLHLAYFLSAISFYLRDIMLLRILAIVSSLVGIGYQFFAPAEPSWTVVAWLSLFTFINASRIVGLWIERRRVSLNEEEQELFEVVFNKFTAVEFMKLLRLGHWHSADEGEVIAQQGEELQDLKLISNGEVSILKNDVEVDRSRDGALIGEMSFISGGPATATVRCERETRYLSWAKEDLRKLLKRNPTMDIAMTSVFSRDLTRKLAER